MSTENRRIMNKAVIKVIGVGGAGGNAINTMIESGLTGVEFIAANTDIQSLQSSKASIKIQLGNELTKGLGAGANPDVGRDAALESKSIIQEILSGADMVFVTAGMGGGTGTGSAPIIAQVARELGALTIGVVTKPFNFEGKKRVRYAEMGITQLKNGVDALITVPNQRLLAIAGEDLTMLDAFKLADSVLLNAVSGISDIINIQGIVNQDFADVRTIMSQTGMALMGTGECSGKTRAQEAARAAINSPLLEDIDIEGATGVLINFTGPSNMTLFEVSEAATVIQEAAHEDANVIFGAVVDDTLGDKVRVTVIATGFDRAEVQYPESRFATAFPQQTIAQMPPQTPYHAMPSQNARPMNHSNMVNSPTGMRPQPTYANGRAPQNQVSQGYDTPEITRRAPQPQQAPQAPLMQNLQTPPAAQTVQPRMPQESFQAREPRREAVPNFQRHTEFEDLTQLTLQMAQAVEAEDAAANRAQRAQESTPEPRPIMGASYGSEQDLTAAALNLAKELGDIDMSDDTTDFETPAFMRHRRDERTVSP